MAKIRNKNMLYLFLRVPLKGLEDYISSLSLTKLTHSSLSRARGEIVVSECERSKAVVFENFNLSFFFKLPQITQKINSCHNVFVKSGALCATPLAKKFCFNCCVHK